MGINVKTCLLHTINIDFNNKMPFCNIHFSGLLKDLKMGEISISSIIFIVYFQSFTDYLKLVVLIYRYFVNTLAGHSDQVLFLINQLQFFEHWVSILHEHRVCFLSRENYRLIEVINNN